MTNMSCMLVKGLRTLSRPDPIGRDTCLGLGIVKARHLMGQVTKLAIVIILLGVLVKGFACVKLRLELSC